jgi:hypothetical protein
MRLEWISMRQKMDTMCLERTDMGLRKGMPARTRRCMGLIQAGRALEKHGEAPGSVSRRLAIG